jgi:hypothetical protein
MHIAHGDLWWSNFASLASYGGQGDRYKREREEEMRKHSREGITRALSMILHHWWLGEALGAD